MSENPLYPESPYSPDRGDFPPKVDSIPDGKQRIREERQRQIRIEGFDHVHDRQHNVQDLVDAANCYLFEVSYAADAPADQKVGTGLGRLEAHSGAKTPCPSSWPWHASWWKPSDNRLRNLEKAGALYAAASDIAAWASNNVGDLIDQEIHKRLNREGLV